MNKKIQEIQEGLLNTKIQGQALVNELRSGFDQIFLFKQLSKSLTPLQKVLSAFRYSEDIHNRGIGVLENGLVVMEQLKSFQDFHRIEDSASALLQRLARLVLSLNRVGKEIKNVTRILQQILKNPLQILTHVLSLLKMLVSVGSIIGEYSRLGNNIASEWSEAFDSINRTIGAKPKKVIISTEAEKINQAFQMLAKNGTVQIIDKAYIAVKHVLRDINDFLNSILRSLVPNILSLNN